MALKKYIIGTPEGAAFVQSKLNDPEAPTQEVGAQVGLDLDEGTELALLCAGWLTDPAAEASADAPAATTNKSTKSTTT